MRDEEKLNKRAAKFHGNGISGHLKLNYGYSNANSLIIQAKAKNDCISVLNHFGTEVTPGKNICCPIHGETNPSCSVYAGGKKAKCFSCGASGDCIDWYAALSGKDKATAIKELARNKLKPAESQAIPVSKRIAPRSTAPTASNPALNPKADFKSFIVDYADLTHEEILAELQKRSSFQPVSMTDYKSAAEAIAFIEALYDQEDFLFLGDKFDAKKRQHVMLRNSWIKAIEAYGVQHPFICLNPVSPRGALNDDGVLSFRTKRNIAKHKYSLFENDNVDLRDQSVFWYKMILKGFPVMALTFSGNKSLHAVVETQLHEIENLKAVFTRLGFDSKTFDPARQSRLPGHWREDTQKFQKLLYLRG